MAKSIAMIFGVIYTVVGVLGFIPALGGSYTMASNSLLHIADVNVVHNIVHLIYRPQRHESESKDYEFSRQSMEDRWRAGYDDTMHTLRHPEIFERPTGVRGGVYTFDLARDA